jgi:cytochrome P450
MAGLIKDLPPKVHPESMITMIHRRYNLGGLFFLDSWPAESQTLMIIGDPVIAAQVTQKRPLPKSPLYWKVIGHLVGPTSMIHTEGTLWKSMRSMFNPAFTSGHLKSYVPGIIDECLTFCEVLTEHANKGDMFSLEEAATRLTIDVIGLVALGAELRSQTTENELVTAFRKQGSWTNLSGDLNPFKKLNPLRPIMTTYYKRIIDGYIERLIDKRSEARQSGTEMDQKPAIDLALNEFAAQQGGQLKSDGILSTFRGFKLAVIDQMKTFMFAGHDTTSSTICYIYYMLSLHPEKLDKVLREHDKFFSRDNSLAAGQLKANPNLLSDLPYTVAVIRGKW